MACRPSRVLESLAATAVPPASAEHVLGDVAECSASHGEYLRNLASILPTVVWCQIRRRVHRGGVLLNAALSAVVLTAAQGVPSSFFSEPWAGLRLAAPWAIWVAGCVLAVAYGSPRAPRSGSPRVVFGTAVIAVGVAAGLGVPAVRVAVGLGVVFGLLLALTLPWLGRPSLQPPLSVDTLPEQARSFQRTIWWRNAREAAAALLVLAFNVPDVWRAETELQRAGHTLLIAGVCFIIGYLYVRAGTRQPPTQGGIGALLRFHRRELRRQRDILRAVPLWYLLPLTPGIVVLGAARWERTASPGGVVAIGLVAGMFLVVWRLNVWAASWLDRQAHDAEALEVS